MQTRRSFAVALSALAVAAACGAVSKLKASEPSAPSADGERMDSGEGKIFTMPDLAGMTKDQAIAALHKLGVTGTIDSDDNYVCENPKVGELITCTTAPAAGQQTKTTLPITLHLRPKGTATYAMPDLHGKTVAEAQKLLDEMSNSHQRIEVDTLGYHPPASECAPETICKQDPKPGVITNEHETKGVTIAPPPAQED